MSEPSLPLFCATLFLVSVLYSCVGQTGASGYIAAMALFGFAPAAIRPTALVLNALVSLIVSWRFHRAGHLSWRLLLPFALASLPAAALGGYLTLPPLLFNRFLGALLLVAAVPLLFRRESAPEPAAAPSLPAALLVGAGVGFLSGLTGVGGGVLITPLLLFRRWAAPKTAAAVSAVFILVNSLAALAGHFGASRNLPPGLPMFALAAVAGGAVGSQLGSVHLSARAISRLLGIVLLIASIKLLLV